MKWQPKDYFIACITTPWDKLCFSTPTAVFKQFRSSFCSKKSKHGRGNGTATGTPTTLAGKKPYAGSIAFKPKTLCYKYPVVLYLKKPQNSPVTGSFIKFNTAPGFSLMLKQMASSFCGTDMMKCGSPSTVKANHGYLYSQAQSSTWTFNVVTTELLMLGPAGTGSCRSCIPSLVQLILQRSGGFPRKLLPSPQRELQPFPPHLSQKRDIYPGPLDCEEILVV